MTYYELLKRLSHLNDEQLGADVTVELGLTDECYAAEFRICDVGHDSLDEDHPVIYAEDA